MHCIKLNDNIFSVFTNKYVDNVPIPKQIFQGIENGKLLDIIIKKVQQNLEELKTEVRDLMKFILDY